MPKFFIYFKMICVPYFNSALMVVMAVCTYESSPAVGGHHMVKEGMCEPLKSSKT